MILFSTYLCIQDFFLKIKNKSNFIVLTKKWSDLNFQDFFLYYSFFCDKFLYFDTFFKNLFFFFKIKSKLLSFFFLYTYIYINYCFKSKATAIFIIIFYFNKFDFIKIKEFIILNNKKYIYFEKNKKLDKKGKDIFKKFIFLKENKFLFWKNNFYFNLLDFNNFKKFILRVKNLTIFNNIKTNNFFLMKFLKNSKLNDYVFFYLRKNRVFNKGRYSRNRQNFRTGVYWCLYINIVAVLGIYYFFYKFTINFGYLWWVFIIFINCFFFNKFFKLSIFSIYKLLFFFKKLLVWYFFMFNNFYNILKNNLK